MGMYTELAIGFDLRADTPDEVVETLAWMVDPKNGLPESFPTEHPLFGTPRWGHMLQCDSYSFSGATFAALRRDRTTRQWEFAVRCNLKNYDDEIKKFLSWLQPHVEANRDEYLGHYRYEEEAFPTMIYWDGSRFKFLDALALKEATDGVQTQ